MKSRSNIILTILGVGVFAYVIYTAGINEVAQVLASTKVKPLLMAVVLFSLSQFLRIEKWKIMSRTVLLKINNPDLIKFYFHTRLMGLVTPFRSGEVVPAFFKENDKDKFFSLTIADRFYESLTTLILIALALYFLFAGLFGGNAWLVVGLMIAALVAFYLLFTVENFYLLFKSAIRYPGRQNREKNLRNKFIAFLDEVYISIKKTLGVRISLLLFFITMAATLLDVLFFKYIFGAVGIDMGFGDATVAFSFLYLITFVSPTPSGVGIGDAGYLALATRLGVGTPGQIGSFLILSRVLIVLLTLLYLFLSSALKTEKVPDNSC